MFSWEHPLVIALAATFFPSLLAFLAHTRGVASDKSVDKYNLMDNLQEDNKVLRDAMKGCEGKLEQVLIVNSQLLEEVRKLTERL